MTPYLHVPLSLLSTPLNNTFQTPISMEPMLILWLSELFHIAKLWELCQYTKAPFQVSTAVSWQHMPEVIDKEASASQNIQVLATI